jgi:hypothetical protein
VKLKKCLNFANFFVIWNSLKVNVIIMLFNNYILGAIMKRLFLLTLSTIMLLALAAPVSTFAQEPEGEADYGEHKEWFKEQVPSLLSDPTNAGTDFYITFHPCWEETGPNNRLKVYVSSGVKTTVTLEIPGLGIFRQKQTIPNDVIEFELEPQEGQMYSKGSGAQPIPPLPAQVWDRRAIRVYADYPIVVYGVTRYRYTSDGFLAIPTSTLGKNYVVSSWADPTTNVSQYLPSFTSIVAVYDNTQVTFRLGGREGGKVPLPDNDTLYFNETIKKTMFKGDVLLIPGIGPYNDLTGSTIRASKPINVLSGNFCAYIPTHVSACDFIIEQELPMFTWGTKYHVTPMIRRVNNSIIKVFPKIPNTQIYRDNLPLGKLVSVGGVKGLGFLEMRAAEGDKRPVVISGDNPIYVVQYNPGQSDDQVESDPFQLVLTPIEQYQDEIIFNTPGIRGGYGFKQNYINLVYKSTEDGGIPDDIEFAEVSGGQFIWKKLNATDGNPGEPFNDFDEETGRQWKSKTIVLKHDGVYKLRGESKFAAYAYGFDQWDSYGFPTSVALADLEVPDTLAPFIDYVWECDGTVRDAEVTDEPVLNPLERSNLGVVRMDPTDSWNYEFKYDEFIIGQDPKTNWSLEVLDKALPAQAHLVFRDRVGNTFDTTFVYTPIDLDLQPYAHNYGTFKEGDPEAKKTFTLTNNSPNAVEIRTISLLSDSVPGQDPTNFRIDYGSLSKTLPFQMAAEEQLTFDVYFNPAAEGTFRDSIGVGDDCSFIYRSLVEAFVGTPYIIADDHNFMQVIVNQEKSRDIAVHNDSDNPQTPPTTSLKVSDYEITGPDADKVIVVDDPTETRTLADADVVFALDRLDEIRRNPWVIDPNQQKAFKVTFSPEAVTSYTFNVVFTHDGVVVDEISVITGEGVQPGLTANDYDWMERRVDMNAYKLDGNPPFAFTAYPGPGDVITLTNGGSSPAVINNISVVQGEDVNGGAFRLESDPTKKLNNKNVLDQTFQITLQPGESRLFPVVFHPEINGDHRLLIRFSGDDGIEATTLLEGVGIFPRVTGVGHDFGNTIVGTGQLTGTVTFTNNNWENDDVLNIYDLEALDQDLTLPNGGGIFTYDKDNVTDGNGNVMTWPLQVAPGESFSVPVTFEPTANGSFDADLRTVSDAEQEATVTVTGSAEVLGASIVGDEVTTCVQLPKTLEAVVTSSSTIEGSIEAVRIDGTGILNFNPADFDLSAIQLPLTLPAGGSQNLPVAFTPNPTYLYTNANVVLEVDVNLGNGDMETLYADFLVTSTHETFNTYSLVSEGGGTGTEVELDAIDPGKEGAIGYTVFGDFTAAVPDAIDNQYIITVDFSRDFLGINGDVNNPEVIVGQGLAARGFGIVDLQRDLDANSNIETVTVTIEGPAPITENAGTIELLHITFDTFLPWYRNEDGSIAMKSKESAILHTVTNTDVCYDFTYESSLVRLDSTCVDPLRQIKISDVASYLGEVNPNPVNENGADIHYSVGLNNVYTEINIYNANSELVSQPVSGVRNVGEYSVRIPVEELSSGVYFYEMTSGPYTEMRKLIIRK